VGTVVWQRGPQHGECSSYGQQKGKTQAKNHLCEGAPEKEQGPADGGRSGCGRKAEHHCRHHQGEGLTETETGFG